MNGTVIPGTSVIVPSRNRPQLLADVVRSVLTADEVPQELLVVDQSDVRQTALDSLERCVATRVHYLWKPDRGVSRGINRGIRTSTQPILAFVHDDCLVARDWLGAMVRELQAAGEGTLVTGRVVPGESEMAGAFVPQMVVDDNPREYSGRVHQDVLYPNNMAFHRSASDEIGFFDERLGPGTPFPAAEDNDFGFRALEAGYRIRYVPDGVVTHRAWRGRDSFLPLRWAYGRGQGAFYVKHLRASDRYMLDRLTYDVGRHLRRIPRGVLRERRQAVADAVYSAAVLSGGAEWAIRYRKVRSWRRS